MNQGLGFEIMPFEITPEFEGESYEGEFEYEGGFETEFGAPVRSRPVFKYVTDFSGPAVECVRSLRRAGKTKAQALSLINAQIGVGITMLRKAATDLKRDRYFQGTGLVDLMRAIQSV